MLTPFNTTPAWQFDPSKMLPPLPADEGPINIVNGQVLRPVTIEIPISEDDFIEEWEDECLQP